MVRHNSNGLRLIFLLNFFLRPVETSLMKRVSKRALFSIHAAAAALIWVNAPAPARAQDNGVPLTSFCPGEKHELEVTYLGVPGLNVTLEVLPPETLDGKTAFRARGWARSSALVGLFFKINDTVETWVDPNRLNSRKFRLVQDESRLQREAIETYDLEKLESVYENRAQRKNENEQRSRENFPIPQLKAPLQDTFSSIFALRTLPMIEGASYVVPVMSEGRIIEAGVTVTGRKTLVARGRREEAFVIRLVKLNQDGSPPAVENIVYLSADARRALLEFSVYSRFGHIMASLKGFEPGECQK